MSHGTWDVVPKGWLSSAYTVSDGGRVLADVKPSLWKEAFSELVVDGTPYRTGRDRNFGPFYLEAPGRRVASATKRSFWTQELDVEADGRKYVLRPPRWWRRDFVLQTSDGRVVGSVRPASWASRRAHADLPPELSIPARVFVVILVMTLWKRSAAATASSAPPVI
jgi:hypothetical protein